MVLVRRAECRAVCTRVVLAGALAMATKVEEAEGVTMAEAGDGIQVVVEAAAMQYQAAQE